VGITRPITKHNYLVKDVADLGRVLKEAFHIARTGRPGPVLIDLPVDVATGTVEDYKYPDEVSIRGYKPNAKGHPRQIAKAAEEIAAAKKPIILAGGGIIHSGAHKELRALAEKANIPVTTTMMGMGGFPGDHSLFLGMPGMHGSRAANYALTNCDLVISIGARFDDRVTGNTSTFAPNARIVHIDIDPAAIFKIITVHVPVVGDAKTILADLCEKVAARQRDDWNAQVDDYKRKFPFTYKTEGDSIPPQFVIEELHRISRGDVIVTTEVGQNQMWAANFFPYTHPRQLITSGGLGTMGYGLPAAMGAQLGKPRMAVVDIAGDGSIQMNIQELATLKLNEIPVKVIILNNGYLGMVRQWQELFWNKNYSSTCLMRTPDCPRICDKQGEHCRPYVPDFVRLAEAYEIPGYRATKYCEVGEVLAKGLAEKGPCVMEFIVRREENVFPMVPAGKSINEMIGEG